MGGSSIKGISVIQIDGCRVCRNRELIEIPSLGDQIIINFSDTIDMGRFSAPLDLVICGKCGLLQLKYTVSREIMYKKYWYRSGISTLMVSFLRDIVISAQKFVELSPGDIVIDIGANDGTLLRQYGQLGLKKIGFEPSNLFKYGSNSDIHMINDFFNYVSFRKEVGNATAKIITSIAMFYDLDDPNEFVEDIKKCLHPDGLWIIQMNYLGSMLKNYSFDNISHEHLEYYSLHALKYLLDMHGLSIIKAELNEVNGGSIRAYITLKNSGVKVSEEDLSDVQKLLTSEIESNLLSVTTYVSYFNRIKEIGLCLSKFINEEKTKGKIIGIYGASTRGFVLLQYFKINSNLVSFAIDKNPEKWGKFIPGTGLKIYEPNAIYKMKADYLLLLPYHLLDEIIIQESKFLEQGGKIIVPLPEPALVSSSGKELLR